MFWSIKNDFTFSTTIVYINVNLTKTFFILALYFMILIAKLLSSTSSFIKRPFVCCSQWVKYCLSLLCVTKMHAYIFEVFGMQLNLNKTLLNIVDPLHFALIFSQDHIIKKLNLELLVNFIECIIYLLISLLILNNKACSIACWYAGEAAYCCWLKIF